MSTGILNSIKAELVKFAGARRLNIFKPHIEKFTRERKMFSDTREFSAVKLIQKQTKLPNPQCNNKLSVLFNFGTGLAFHIGG